MDHPSPQPPFDPLLQNISFYGPDGITPIDVPIPAVDAFNDESISICINYGAQIGACFIMLLAMLVMTPAAKLCRPSGLLHLAGLAVCLVRAVLLAVAYVSPMNHLYQFWSGDYTAVPSRYMRNTVAGDVMSLLLVVVVEAALMNQAWTMVTLWPDAARYSLAAASVVVALVTVGFRLALTIVHGHNSSSPKDFFWIMQGALVTSALSICWFCALFNMKLVLHLVANRGILPSARTLSSMELLVMTNGILMVVPVIFAGLEWGHFQNFEAASLTSTSVAIILPLGTLAAQQMTARPSAAASSLAYYPNSGSSAGGGGRCRGSSSSNNNNNNNNNNNSKLRSGSGASTLRFKHPSVSTSCGSSTTRHAPSLVSKCDRRTGGGRRAVGNHLDLELRQMDSTSALADGLGHVRVDRDLEQHDECIS